MTDQLPPARVGTETEAEAARRRYIRDLPDLQQVLFIYDPFYEASAEARGAATATVESLARIADADLSNIPLEWLIHLCVTQFGFLTWFPQGAAYSISAWLEYYSYHYELFGEWSDEPSDEPWEDRIVDGQPTTIFSRPAHDAILAMLGALDARQGLKLAVAIERCPSNPRGSDDSLQLTLRRYEQMQSGDIVRWADPQDQ